MSAPDVISHNHTARTDTSMHRPGMILIEPGGKPNEFTDNYIIDDYGQPEDRAEWNRMNQASANADAPDLYAPAPRIPRGRPPAAGAVYWGVVAASLVFACYFIGVHVLASWGQQ